jgi:hypothetical protein
MDSYKLIENKYSSSDDSLVDNNSIISSPTKAKQSRVESRFIHQFLNMIQIHRALTRKYKYLFVALIIVGALFVFYQSYLIDKPKRNDIFYNIVFDAGSTGTRIHVFKIRHVNDDNINEFDAQLIKEELVIKVKPGLSSYHSDPDKV